MQRLSASILLLVLTAAGVSAQQHINPDNVDRDHPRARHVFAVLDPLLAGEIDAALVALENGAEGANGDAMKRTVRQLAAQFGDGTYRVERLLDAPIGVAAILRHADGQTAGIFFAVEATSPHRIRSIQEGMIQGGNAQQRVRVPAGGEPVTAAATPTSTAAGGMLMHEAAEFEVHAATADALERGRIAMEHVVGEYRRYFDQAPPRLGFIVYSDRDQARALEAALAERNLATFVWPAESRRGPGDGDGQPTLEPTSTNTLAHEAMHGLMRARFGERRLPPWFDEGIASLVEFPDEQRVRHWDKLRAADASLMPLATLFARPHPTAGISLSGAAAAAALADAEAGRPIRIQVSPDQVQDGGLFYAQSMAFLTFLAEREGPAFVGRMAEALAGGATAESVLRTGRSFADGTAGLETAWLVWLRQRRTTS